jgi:hypothetical protein
MLASTPFAAPAPCNGYRKARKTLSNYHSVGSLLGSTNGCRSYDHSISVKNNNYMSASLSHLYTRQLRLPHNRIDPLELFKADMI